MPATRITTRQWVVLLLLVVSVFINYVDRTNLSVAAPTLLGELSLRPSRLGDLLSAFFWTYALFMMVSGWLVDRYNVNWVLAMGFLVWSLATAATGLAGGFVSLFASRLLLGAGESVAYPAYSKILASHFPEHRRGLTNALIDAGSKIGPALGTLIGGLVVARYGWRLLFLVLGLGALPWLLPWAAWALPVKAESVEEIRDRAGYLQILRQRSAWGTFLGLFAINYAWYFSLTWLPYYLVMERHFSLKTMAILGSLPFWGLAVSVTLSGWLADRLIARGASVTRVRKTFAATGLLLLGGFILPAVVVPDHRVAIVLLIAGFFSFGLTTSNHWAISQTLAGPLASGRWTGVQNAVGNLAGVIAPKVTGLIVEKTGSFYLAFVAVCVVLVLGAIGFVFVVGPIAPVFKTADCTDRTLP